MRWSIFGQSIAPLKYPSNPNLRDIRSVYQLAFLTPGIFPASAFIRKLYCNHRGLASVAWWPKWSDPRRACPSSLVDSNDSPRWTHVCQALENKVFQEQWQTRYIKEDHLPTRLILKSLNIPLPLPPSIHLFLICVDLVYACISASCSCACARVRGGRLRFRMMYLKACLFDTALVSFILPRERYMRGKSKKGTFLSPTPRKPSAWCDHEWLWCWQSTPSQAFLLGTWTSWKAFFLSFRC